MDYQAIARSVLQALPASELQPRSTKKLSDDECIAQVVWMRIRLETMLNQA
ncbi:hypothetical protein IFO70_22000 [Phormidium tenue FACHB-886]|nr:hypothetical protein [Phormidium tenue FACHB-886]